jgi:hypothetical protein
MPNQQHEGSSRRTVQMVPIKGSKRRALDGIRVIGATDSTATIKISLYARQNPATRFERSRVLKATRKVSYA